MPRGHQAQRRGQVGAFDIKGCTDSLVEYLDKHDDGERFALAALVDPLKYKTKAQPSKKGYRPCLWSLAKRADILNIMVEKSFKKDGLVVWDDQHEMFSNLSMALWFKCKTIIISYLIYKQNTRTNKGVSKTIGEG